MEHHAQTKEIWSQMHQRLLFYIRGRVDKLHDAEDILQDVFVRIHANLDDVKDTEKRATKAASLKSSTTSTAI